MTRPIFVCGAVLALSLGTVGWLDARAETAAFLGLLGVAAAAYLTSLSLVARRPPGSSRALAGCLLLGLVWRVVLITGAPLVSDDVYRYIWDGRVQRFGHDPYQSVPDDPELAHLHTESTARIDPASARLPTIYPPAAQLFFRAATTVHESVTMMATAVVITDLLTALVLWRWLVYQQRNPWWVLAYAWHPLVALEGAGGGHIDVVGTLGVVAAAYALSRRRSGVAAVALAVSFSVKFLPLVLFPLLWKRIRVRDGVLAAAVVVLLYLPFSDGLRPRSDPFWSMPSSGASMVRSSRGSSDGWGRPGRWSSPSAAGWLPLSWPGFGYLGRRQRPGRGQWRPPCSSCPPCIPGT